MLSHDNSEQRVERVRVRLEGSTWSVPFGLDQVSHVLARVSAGDSLSTVGGDFQSSEMRGELEPECPISPNTRGVTGACCRVDRTMVDFSYDTRDKLSDRCANCSTLQPDVTQDTPAVNF